ncbi:MAG: hypothetical protein IPP71_02245 [Bacteroidetes bacterium]|nr:hypothetical protein [Bacteroidota bacterium]
MKTSLFLMASMLICSILNAQGDSISIPRESRFLVSIYGGPSFAVGKFAEYQTINSAEQNNIKGFNNFNLAGAADLGYAVGVNVSYGITKRFAIGINVEHASNKTGEVQYPELYYPISGLPGSEKSYDSENWKSTNFFLMPKYTLPFRKWELAFMLKVGIQTASSPVTKMVIETIAIDPFNGNDKNILTYNQPSLKDLAIAYGFGLEGRFALSKRIKFVINCNYATANHSFSSGAELEYQSKTVSLGSTNTRNYKVPFNFKKQFSTITPGIGINFKI